MKKWHITITENETGNTKLDIDTDAIIAGIDENEGTRIVHAVECPVTDHAATIAGVLDNIKAARKEDPVVDHLLTMWEKKQAKKPKRVTFFSKLARLIHSKNAEGQA